MRPCTHLLIFDLDDTLVDTSHIFYEVRRNFVAMMARKGFPESEVTFVFNEVDRKNLDSFGYVSERNLVTLRETYELLMANRIDDFSHSDLKQIASIGSDCLYKLPVEMPFARELVGWCHEKFRMILVTRGSIALQYAKINKLGVRPLFEQIRVLKAKDAEAFLDVARMADCNPENCISIGDSMRFDILPAFEIGMHAIHVQYPNEQMQWEHDKAPAVTNEQRIFRARNLREVLELLKNLIAPSVPSLASLS